MPKYKVTLHDEGGAVYTVDAGSEPEARAKAMQQHSQHGRVAAPPKPKEFPRSNALGGMELLAAAGTGMVAEPVAGLAGLAQTLNPFAPPGAGAQAVQDTRNAIQYKPTQHGQALGQDIAGYGAGLFNDARAAGTEYATGGSNPIMGPLGLLADATGQAATDVTTTSPDWWAQNAGPAAGAFAKTLPTAVGTVASLGLGNQGANRVQARVPATSARGGMVEDLKRAAKGYGPLGGSRETAKLTLTESGKVIADKLAKAAIKQGWDDGVVSAIKTSSRTDKSKMLKMVRIKRAALKNARFEVLNRPSDVVGDTLHQRYRVVLDANRKAGSSLDRVAKSLRRKPVNVDEAVDEFLKSMDDMGIDLSRFDDWGTLEADDVADLFIGSDIEGLAGPQNALMRAAKRVTKLYGQGPTGRVADAYNVHRLKRFIDENVTFGKFGEGLSGKTELILKKLRRSLDGALDSEFPDYNEVNSIYSETRGVIDDLQSIAGKRMALDGPNADKALGVLLRRIASNAQSRVPLLDTANSLEEVARKYATRGLDDDLIAQIMFADELDKVFGTGARTSFQGQIEQGVGTALQKAARGRGMKEAAVDVAVGVADAARGVNKEEAFKAIENLLRK